VQSITPPPGDLRPSVSPPTGMYLIECQAAVLDVARRLEWLAVADPSLLRTARAAFWVASRIHGDRMVLR